METTSPRNTNLPSTQTAHSDFPMVVENHNHNPHTGTETGTGTETESRNGVNTSHSEISIQPPPPPSYNAHADQHSSEKRTVEDNHHGSHEHDSSETPPQFRIHPDVMSGNTNANENGGGKYEGQHPAPLTSLQKESRLWKRSGKTEVSVAASAAAASGNAGGVGGAGGK
ncbi:hypothetical protein BTUL_0099g00290 [Botrytis tulipae]|uniref:Uncharacterized protein n=1 Tax=Botrytis tulipae TaxID=87230 RepID=A0A4Z1EHV7_9HELO|nr:hypothetical protein BTUL_0099g00290 [Botrytis tulipae]